MMSRLAEIEKKYEELGRMLSDPGIVASLDNLRVYSKEHSDLTPIVEAYRRYRSLHEQLAEVEGMIREEKDSDMVALAREEKNGLAGEMADLQGRLKRLLIPKDPLDEKNILLEIRAGTGGDEASLFVADLMRMYIRYAEQKGWSVETLSSSPTELGGFREIILLFKGSRVYSVLKFEGGVHRVQRVPETESSGRIHTSAVSVAIMPEAEDVEVQINPEDVRVDVFRATGCGGQCVNTTDSAVRLTHLPTGIVVSCQDEKSQHKNKAKAMKILKARIFKVKQDEQRAEQDGVRRSMVGSGDRSERIRTYNFPQGRVTDHRINLTLYRLEAIMDGDLDEVTQALVASDQAEHLKSMEVA
ncbi:MAG: peptide chain release factor 1 [Deltaproteobacteria bacterium]|nr:peptide chain release factor 1 [Deltaproteobacteria bacterium]